MTVAILTIFESGTLAISRLAKTHLEYRSREEAQPAFWFVVIPEEVYLPGRPHMPREPAPSAVNGIFNSRLPGVHQLAGKPNGAGRSMAKASARSV